MNSLNRSRSPSTLLWTMFSASPARSAKPGSGWPTGSRPRRPPSRHPKPTTTKRRPTRGRFERPGLAEAGYVVLTFDPQGQGQSEADGHPRYCDPDGKWREPQEMGIREQGRCAGHDQYSVVLCGIVGLVGWVAQEL